MAPNYPKNVKGFTLVEVMVGLFVLAVVVGGIFSATIMTKRVAVHNLYENAAFTAARSYAEQLKAMSYDDVRDAVIGGSSVTLEFRSLDFDAAESNLSNLENTELISFRQTFSKSITVDDLGQRDGSAPKEIQLSITLNGNDLSGSLDWDAVEITVDYSWVLNTGNSIRTLSKSFSQLKTNV